MFYSHQLLARKAPLGQIWMAATLHAKMNRKKLDKLDLIKICEEILNPSVPMALRLSGILMGGVVIVYERKVKLLYDDVTRLVVEINEAWKIKQPASSADPTLLPKSKTQAKYKSVTLPPIDEGDPTVFDQSLNFTVMGRFQQQPPIEYVTMNLDQVDATSFFTNQNSGSGDIHNHHQAEAANITLMDPYDSNQATASLFDRFERFDIEGDEDTQMNIATGVHSRGHSDHLHFTPIEEFPDQELLPQEVPPQQVSPVVEEIRDVLPESQKQQQLSDERGEDAQQVQEEQQPEPRVTKRKARSRKNHIEMDYEQTMIPGELYQSWLQKPADLVAGRGINKKHLKPMSYMKTAHLMELPPTALLNGFSEFGSTEVYYPKALLDLHMECVYPQPQQTSSSSSQGRKSTRRHPVASSSPTEAARSAGTEAPPPVDNQHPLELPVEDVRSGIGSQPTQVSSIDTQMKNLRVDSATKQLSIEKQMEKLDIYEFPHVTPGSEGSNEKPVHSSGSGNGLLPMEPLERSSKKRGLISGRQSAGGSGLDPVAEENPWDLAEPTLKIRRISEEAPVNDHETLMETGPTQTPLPVFDDLQPLDKMTDAVRTHLKTHFDTPGNSAFESLNSLTSGMKTKRASLLFMQTLVLATHNVLRVQQAEPYGDILISKGPKM